MRVCFTNLGCKLNQAETESLARDFLAAGHLVVGSPAEADLHVVNSCTVTHTAARASEKDRLLEHVQAAFPDLAPSEVPVPWVHLPFGHTRALVKVEDGCNMRCSFCIIPSTRGRQRSRPLAEVVEEVRSLVEAGYKEVVVTGVQISAYRSGDDRLYELVRAILERTEVPRLRLTSIAPWDLDARLLD